MSPLLLEPLVRAALLEDFGRAGDITSDAVIPGGTQASAAFVARRPGTVAGLALAETACRLVGSGLRFTAETQDGQEVRPGQVLARVSGDARAILGAERVALNYLGHLSGIATATSAMVRAIAHTRARVACTRKTTPGLRAVEKYAVRCGGGANHRFGLDDAMLIKDNHIALAGGIGPALRRAREAAGHLVRIEIEVDTLEQLAQVMEIGADAVLLDNMNPDQLRQAVDLVAGRAVTEASGGITLQTAPMIAESGVDLLSAGWLTHSAAALDIGLDF